MAMLCEFYRLILFQKEKLLSTCLWDVHIFSTTFFVLEVWCKLFQQLATGLARLYERLIVTFQMKDIKNNDIRNIKLTTEKMCL